MTPSARIIREGEAQVLLLAGPWETAWLGTVETVLKTLPQVTPGRLVVDGSGLEAVDTSGAWLLIRWLRQRVAAGVALEQRGFTEDQTRLFALMEKVEHVPSPVAKRPAWWRILPEQLGAVTIDFFSGLFGLLAFFGRLSATAGHVVLHPSHWRMLSTTYHLYQHGLRAVPIIGLMAFLISIVLGYQGATQLQKFGADVFTIDLVAISLLREMGVLVTAIMVAGRSGSAFAAQIGVMQVNQEVDAMRSLGLDPFELLVLPRMIALLIALPLLTLLSDLVGLAGAWFVAVVLLDMSWMQFLTRLDAVISPQTFFIGLCKAPVFALLIGLVGCQRGMLVRGSADQVGQQTIMAVVQAIFLVIMFDALFSILFTVLGI